MSPFAEPFDVRGGKRYNAAVFLHVLFDDGALTYGGTPRLLSSHPSVRMARERVVLTIKRKGCHVDATFVFTNDGPACKVRMGFPDRGEGAEGTVFGEDTAEAQEKGLKKPVYAGLSGFSSSVDGKRVATTLVPDGDAAQSWHTKIVDFAKGQTRIVRVAYDSGGEGATSTDYTYIQQASYILHTGASWKGPIGYAEVVVRFPKGFAPKVAAASSLGAAAYEFKNWNRKPKNIVVWSGFAKPTVKGNELRFVRRAFEPKVADDLDLYYSPHVSK